jgi:hypothetical protein
LVYSTASRNRKKLAAKLQENSEMRKSVDGIEKRNINIKGPVAQNKIYKSPEQ